MAIQTGVNKKVAFKKETTWGVAPSPMTGAQYLRRVTSDIDLKKETYQSNEIRTDYQVSDMRHGLRSVEGTLDCELSPGSYQAFMSAALRKLFAIVSADITALGLTIAVATPATTPATYTVTRAAGDWLTSGIKVGNVIRITAGTYANAINRDNNLFIIGMTTTILTVMVMNGSVLIAEGPISGSTVNVPGMGSYVPETSHTEDSFAIEHVYADITQSELFLGCKVNTMDVSLPPQGMAMVKFGFMGKDVTTNTAAQFTTPTAATTSGVVAAVNGVMGVAGAPAALLTGLSFSVNANRSSEAVVGSNSPPAIYAGSVTVTGEATVLLQDATYRDYFLNETEVSLSIGLSTGSSKTADFITFTMPRVKVGGASKNDGQTGLSMTMPFVALIATTGGSGVANQKTTLMIQDSLAA